MAHSVRIIKTTTGKIVIQDRQDETYNDGNLPVLLVNVADQALVDSSALLETLDPDTQIDVVGSSAVFDLLQNPRSLGYLSQVPVAQTHLNNIDGWVIGDFDHSHVKGFLEAIADLTWPIRTGGPVSPPPL